MRLLGAVLAAFAFFLPRTGIAMWASMSDDELVASSELIVIGEWLGQTAVTLPGATGAQTFGVIAVAEVLKGQRETGFVLVQRPAASALRSSSDLNFERGQKGLWLLRAVPGAKGLYAFDHPQRFVSAATDPARIAALRRLTARN